MFTVINICIYTSMDGSINQSECNRLRVIIQCASNALLWQNEASDIPSKSELLMFHIKPCVLFFQAKLYT